MNRALALVLALALFVAWAGRSAAAPPPAGAPVAAITRVEGVPCVSATEMARLLGGSLFWRADIRKLVVRAQGHRLTFTVDAPLVLIDDRMLRLDAPVRAVGGELQVPVSLIAALPRDSASVRLVVEPVAGRVRVAPPEGYVGMPRVTVEGEWTRVTLVTAHGAQARVVGRGREHFRLWLPGAPAAGVPDSLPASSLVRSLARPPGGEGVTWELGLAPGTAGWRLSAPAGQDVVVLEFARTDFGLERFGAEAPSGPRPLRVVVLDPGHGGEDAGVTVNGVIEKDLTLALARELAAELVRRTGARVLLTREADRALAQPARAEIANRARADLVLSLHFDGAPGTAAHGATAYCAPAPGEVPGGEGGAGATTLVRWRDVALRHAFDSRALADQLDGALEGRGFGPMRVRERLPVAMLGVNAPGLTLECATLTASADLARVTAPDGLKALATAIADGIIAWARHE